MAMTTGQFSAIVAPGLHKVFAQEYKRRPEIYSKFMNVQTAPKRKYWDDQQITGFGSIPQKQESTAFAFDEAVQGNSKRYTLAQYGLGFRISREMWDDDLYDAMKKMSTLLAHSVANKMEVLGHAVLNDLFAGNTYTGFDSVRAVYSTGHTLLKSGGTYANAPSAATDISQTALQAAITRMERTPDESNLVLNMSASTVIVPTDSKFIMRELLGSESKPYTSDNEVNALKEEGLKWISTPFMTDTDSWALLGDTHDLNFFHRVKPEYTAYDDKNTGDSCNVVYFRNVTGFGDWRGTDGSAGA